MPDDHAGGVEIDPAEWEIVRSVLSAHVPDCEVWAFGSRARREARRYSDLDLVIVSPAPLAGDTLAALAEAFTESDLPWKVDVLDWARVGASFRAVIARDKVVLQRGAAGRGMAPAEHLAGGGRRG